MSEADIPQKAPFKETVQQGKTDFWCNCGKSARQPFCDGSHKGSGFEPVKFTAEENGEVYFAGAKPPPNNPCATARIINSSSARQCEECDGGGGRHV